MVARGPAACCRARVVARSAEVAAELAARAPPPPPPAPEPQPELVVAPSAESSPDEGAPVWGTWWFWTIVGVAVAGGAAAAVVLTRDEGVPDGTIGQIDLR